MKNRKKEQMVEIARSFSYKHNLGNYQTVDFFCSQKSEVPLEDSEQTSKALYEFCKQEVIKSLNEYLKKTIQAEQTKKKVYPSRRLWCKVCRGVVGDHECDNCTYCSTDLVRGEVKERI